MKQSPLERKTPLKRGSGPKRKSAPKRPKPISSFSDAQREKVRRSGCIVTMADALERTVHPAHLAPRTQGGCQDPLCVVGLVPEVHRAFDDGQFDLQPYLVGRHVEELQHALGHYKGDVVGLLQRLTGRRWRANA